MKRILLIVGLFILPCNMAHASDYVSPESYAINEADLYESYKLYSMPQNQNQSEPIKSAITSGKNNGSLFLTMDEAIKSKLRNIRYRMQEPHHGQLHEIKLNSPYKLKQRGLLSDESTTVENSETQDIAKSMSKKERKKTQKELKNAKKLAEEQVKKESRTKKVKTETPKKIKPEKPKKAQKSKSKKQIQPVVEPQKPETPIYDYAETGSTTYDDIYTGVGTNFNL